MQNETSNFYFVYFAITDFIWTYSITLIFFMVYDFAGIFCVEIRFTSRRKSRHESMTVPIMTTWQNKLIIWLQPSRLGLATLLICVSVLILARHSFWDHQKWRVRPRESSNYWLLRNVLRKRFQRRESVSRAIAYFESETPSWTFAAVSNWCKNTLAS